MSYLHAYNDRRNSKVLVWERLENGTRIKRVHDHQYYYYIEDPEGAHTTITKKKATRIDCSSQEDLNQQVMGIPYSKRFETDFTPVERVLMDVYSKLPVPKLNVGFLDIEVDYHARVYKEKETVSIRSIGTDLALNDSTEFILGELRSLPIEETQDIEVYDPSVKKWVPYFISKYAYEGDSGFAGPKNPYGIINAVTLYCSHNNTYYTLAVPPKSWDWNTPLPDYLSHVVLYKTEKELLVKLLDLLHPVDVITGWNTEFYDLPYIAKRIEMVLGEASLSRLGFEGSARPRWTEKARFKNSKVKDPILTLNSRIHLDYMLLFKKFNLESRQSFSLNAIGMDELNEPKVHYSGTLEELYNNDFILFLKYNTHDVTIVKRLDEKFKYIELANQTVHMASVNFESVFGTVQLVDSAIITFAHNINHEIVFDRPNREDGEIVEGAIVLTPKPGLYKQIGSIDIKSLYPSAIRSLNLSPEKIVGQIQSYEDGWRAFHAGMLNPDNQNILGVEIQILFEGESEVIDISIGEFLELCQSQKWAVSGYGTILDQGNGEGILPSVLTYWFKGRIELQGKKKTFAKKAEEVLKGGIQLSKEQLSMLHSL